MDQMIEMRTDEIRLCLDLLRFDVAYRAFLRVPIGEPLEDLTDDIANTAGRDRFRTAQNVLRKLAMQLRPNGRARRHPWPDIQFLLSLDIEESIDTWQDRLQEYIGINDESDFDLAQRRADLAGEAEDVLTDTYHNDIPSGVTILAEAAQQALITVLASHGGLRNGRLRDLVSFTRPRESWEAMFGAKYRDNPGVFDASYDVLEPGPSDLIEVALSAKEFRRLGRAVCTAGEVLESLREEEQDGATPHEDLRLCVRVAARLSAVADAITDDALHQRLDEMASMIPIEASDHPTLDDSKLFRAQCEAKMRVDRRSRRTLEKLRDAPKLFGGPGVMGDEPVYTRWPAKLKRNIDGLVRSVAAMDQEIARREPGKR